MTTDSPFTPEDARRFSEGTHSRLYLKLGAHLLAEGGVRFAVWAPSASAVSVIGDFNDWQNGADPLSVSDSTGVWHGVIPEARRGQRYKYFVENRQSGYSVAKADPVAFFSERPPNTASIIWDLEYEWQDEQWMELRSGRNGMGSPISIYEVHVGSWKRVPKENGRSLNYRELAAELADYVAGLGYTHVEFLPVMEHPFFGSWGYQTTGYFAPSSRFGSPQDFMFLIDALHQRGIGVILDWVPSHFPSDEYALQYFDGTHLYEHADRRQGFHPDWASSIFNYGRNEVRGFLCSSALYWLDKFHVDGIRVDAVASMLYLDYSRGPGEWIPNRLGGRENLDAVELLKQLNTAVYGSFPDAMTIAEESTAWPGVTRPASLGGLGFGLKWDMGWMHDVLKYLARDPVQRQYHHSEITFRADYAFNENFLLPLSHDEVVHGKGSLIGKMPGDDWQKFANLRLLFVLQWAQPGKKLLFMGGEIGQRSEWSHDGQLQWELTRDLRNRGLQKLVSDLNRAYRQEPALHELDCDPAGYEWVDGSDSDQSTISFLRKNRKGNRTVLCVFNFTPVARHDFDVGVPNEGIWEEVLNSDASIYGGSGLGNHGGVHSALGATHGRRHHVTLTIPPLAGLFLVHAQSEAG